jgi:tetratricopeptide (TPR) repeat protein
MATAVLLICAMIGQNGTPAPGAPADFKAYEAAKGNAGRNANAHVELALWCEAHGLTRERTEHLAQAVALEPRNVIARGLMGLVAYQGKWERAQDVEKQVQSDPAYQDLIREYLDRRARTPQKADALMKLAAWCNEKGLKEQALAHYSAVFRLDPTREIAMRHLGYKKHGNHWVKPEEAAAERIEAERQKHADLHWRTRLEKLHEALLSNHPARREKAEQGLAEVKDPRAVPMVWNLFANGGERSQLAAVKVLGQIDGPSASNSLAALAVFSPSDEVRRQATDTLARRDPRDVVGRLINLVRRPFKFTVRPGSGPGSTGELFVDGARFDLRRLYQFPTIDFRLIPFTQGSPMSAPGFSSMTFLPAPTTGVPMMMPSTMMLPNAAPIGQPMVGPARSGPSTINHAGAARAHGGPNMANNLFGLASLNSSLSANYAAEMEMMMFAAMIETLERNQAIQQTLNNDIQVVEAANDQINQVNGRVLPLLSTLTGQDFGADPQPWQKWWTDQLGYVYQSSTPTTKPTFTETVSAPSILFPLAVAGRRHAACFAAGTPVHTIDGLRAIESIQVGDRVLSQNPSTGMLAFQPVLAVHLNDPSPTLAMTIDGETIVATGIHRFWRAGTGWIMARELKAGERLRIIGDVVEIKAIESDKTQPVYNLDVAENRDFFVGTNGLLVHDFSFVNPVLAPFDRQPQLAAPRDAASAAPAKAR